MKEENLNRLTGAFLAAAALAASPTVVLGPWAILAFPAAFGIAGLHIMLVGLPLYLLLRRRVPLSWSVALSGGVVGGALPSALMALRGVTDAGFYPWGWPLAAGGCGLLGGLAFAVVMKWPGAADLQPSDDSAASSSSTSPAVL